MIWVIFGLMLGVFIGVVFEIPIPVEFTRYTAVIILGMLDALFGAIRAEVTQDQYNSIIFLTGLIFNVILAVGITYLGDLLGLDLYLAATIVFTFRIFQNVGITRRSLLSNWLERRAEKDQIRKIAKIIWKE